MDDGAADIPDTTELRQTLAPVLLPQFARILAHAQRMRDWAVHATELSDEDRTALLRHLDALEQTAHTLSAGYAALEPPPSPPQPNR